MLALVLTPVVARFAVMIGAIDMPATRKIHVRPIPRLGGLAVVSAIAIVWIAARWIVHGPWQLPPELVFAVGVGVLPVLVVSLVDDIRSMPAGLKFIAHVVGAVIAVAVGARLGSDVHLFGATIHIGFLTYPLSVLWIVGVTNAFNIIDGLDGLRRRVWHS